MSRTAASRARRAADARDCVVVDGIASPHVAAHPSYSPPRVARACRPSYRARGASSRRASSTGVFENAPCGEIPTPNVHFPRRRRAARVSGGTSPASRDVSRTLASATHPPRASAHSIHPRARPPPAWRTRRGHPEPDADRQISFPLPRRLSSRPPHERSRASDPPPFALNPFHDVGHVPRRGRGRVPRGVERPRSLPRRSLPRPLPRYRGSRPARRRRVRRVRRRRRLSSETGNGASMLVGSQTNVAGSHTGAHRRRSNDRPRPSPALAPGPGPGPAVVTGFDLAASSAAETTCEGSRVSPSARGMSAIATSATTREEARERRRSEARPRPPGRVDARRVCAFRDLETATESGSWSPVERARARTRRARATSSGGTRTRGGGGVGGVEREKRRSPRRLA